MKKLLTPLTCLLLAGCATPNHPLPADYWQHKQQVKVSNDLPKHAAVYHEGGQGLVDIAINNAVTSGFDHYLSTYSLASVRSIQTEFIRHLRKHGVKATAFRKVDVDSLQRSHQDNKEYATRDFRPYKIKMGKNKLLVVSTQLIGAERKYYGFIPLEAPKASCILEGRLVDTHSNKILWRYKSKAKLSVVGKWDQPPNYPNFTKSLNKAVKQAKEGLMENFFMNTSD
jgi:hypothetical protein